MTYWPFIATFYVGIMQIKKVSNFDDSALHHAPSALQQSFWYVKSCIQVIWSPSKKIVHIGRVRHFRWLCDTSFYMVWPLAGFFLPSHLFVLNLFPLDFKILSTCQKCKIHTSNKKLPGISLFSFFILKKVA